MPRVLTLWQPWAQCMVQPLLPDEKSHGVKMPPPKTIETRSWKTKHRGRLIIHAASYRGHGVGQIFEDPSVRSLLTLWGFKPDGSDLPRGKIVGEVSVSNCVPTDDLIDTIDEIELKLGDYGTGRWGWLTQPDLARCYDEPIAAKGSQGLWRVPVNMVPRAP